MAWHREPDPLLELLQREHARVLELIQHVAIGDTDTKRAFTEIRSTLRALAGAETAVLYPVFNKVAVRPEVQCLLDDSRETRALELGALDALVRSRSQRLRKLRALQLSDLVQHHARQKSDVLIPVLHSQLPRTLYRVLANSFATQLAASATTAPVRAPANASVAAPS
ncbi:MAG: hemerythrin domain-containing protein [Kofleriaceae bacterium]